MKNVKIYGDNDTQNLLSDEDIVSFVDGDMSPSRKEKVLVLLMKNDELRRRVSDYVKFKRFENTNKENDECKIPSTLTHKATALFRKYKKNNHYEFDKMEIEKKEPVHINYSNNYYEVTGVVQNDNNTSIILELHITKNGNPYTGEVYIYKGKILYCTLDVHEEYINFTLTNKGNYHIYIKDDVEHSLDMEFDLK